MLAGYVLQLFKYNLSDSRRGIMTTPPPAHPIWPEIERIFGHDRSDEARVRGIAYVRETPPEKLTLAFVLVEHGDHDVVHPSELDWALDTAVEEDRAGSIALVSAFVNAQTRRHARMRASCLVAMLLEDPSTSDQGIKFFEQLLQDADKDVVDRAIDWLEMAHKDTKLEPAVLAEISRLLAPTKHPITS